MASRAKITQSVDQPVEPSEFEQALQGQADAVAVSAGAIASRGMQQLEALEAQTESYVEQFSEAASEILANTEILAWQRTAEKLSAKLGAYSPVDTLSVFNGLSLDTDEFFERINGIRETAALPQGKATAGF